MQEFAICAFMIIWGFIIIWHYEKISPTVMPIKYFHDTSHLVWKSPSGEGRQAAVGWWTGTGENIVSNLLMVLYGI